MSNPTYNGIEYIGDPRFIEQCEPILRKADTGLDQITRKFRGGTYLLPDFIASLHQCDAFSAIDITLGTASPIGTKGEFAKFYLDDWEQSDESRAFITVTLNYLGLLNGILPFPKPVDDLSLQTATIQVNNFITVPDAPDVGTTTALTVQYRAAQTTWTWVETSQPNPNTPKYTAITSKASPWDNIATTYATTTSGVVTPGTDFVKLVRGPHLPGRGVVETVTGYNVTEVLHGLFWLCSSTSSRVIDGTFASLWILNGVVDPPDQNFTPSSGGGGGSGGVVIGH